MNGELSMNNIPLPSSLLRKNNGKRLSMASATRTSLVGNGNSNSNGSGNNSGRGSLMENNGGIGAGAKRRSLLSTPASTNKRRQSSMMQPPMLSSQMSTQSQQMSGGQAGLQQDLRPLRNRNYQGLLQQEIYDFLVTNKFELEMNHPLTAKTLRQPTQKDFATIFQFLYGGVDPNYRFGRSVEAEVYPLLKLLNYPYLDGINRSQISAVGGQHWPNFLGMLYWLVKLNLSLVNLDQENDLVSPDDVFDKIFIQYISQSYQAFIDEKDDYSEYYDEMKVKFDSLNDNIVREISEVEQEQQEFSRQYQELEGQLTALENSEQKSQALENDLVKFRAYIETMEARKHKWAENLARIEQEIDICLRELSKIEEERRECESRLSMQGLTPLDIDNLNNERDILSKAIDSVNNNLEDNKVLYHNKEIELQKNYQSLDNFLKQYNNIIYKILLKNHNFNYNLEISLSRDMNSLLQEIDIPLSPSHIINKNLKDEKIQLLNYKSMVNANTYKYQDEQLRLQEQIDLLAESIMEQEENRETIEARLTAAKSTCDEIYENMISETTTYSMQIEKLERELRSIKINTNQGFIEVENKFQSIQINYDELLYEIHAHRSLLHDKVQRIIESTISFKLNVQQNLENLENLVLEELESETKSTA